MCSHTKESETIYSIYHKSKFRIHGHLRHEFSPMGKIRWFVYSIEDVPCQKMIVGSTQDPAKRWANYKSTCNKQTSKSSGLAKHFMDGCPFDHGKEKMGLSIKLLDSYDTTEEKLLVEGHVPGAKCRCKECNHLKDIEDRWILKLGTFYGDSGLNTRDEIKSKTRGNWK